MGNFYQLGGRQAMSANQSEICLSDIKLDMMWYMLTKVRDLFPLGNRMQPPQDPPRICS